MKESVTVTKFHECQIVTKQHNIEPTKTLKVYFMMVTICGLIFKMARSMLCKVNKF